MGLVFIHRSLLIHFRMERRQCEMKVFVIIDHGQVSVYSDSKVEVEIIDLDDCQNKSDFIHAEQRAQEVMAEYVEAT